jgi:ABC-type Zn uptake system ZnuABC Zn-binding protein ZnuA
MKRIHFFTLLVVTVFFLGAGCTKVAEVSPEKPVVAATISPIYDLVRIVGGEDVDTRLILSPGSSPHTYEPTPSIIKELHGSTVIFQIGHGIDSWVSSITNSLPDTSVVVLDRGVSLRLTTESHDHEHEEEEVVEEEVYESVDPHYWLDPTNASYMVDTIVQSLSQIDPAHEDAFVRRAAEFKDELARKDVEWQLVMQGIANKRLITFHDAFGYFADHFGLEVVATFEPFPGKEPTPQYLVHLKEEIEEHGVKTLYLEPQLSATSLQTFARDNGLTLAVLDPEGSSDRAGYLEMIEYNVKTIVENQ